MDTFSQPELNRPRVLILIEGEEDYAEACRWLDQNKTRPAQFHLVNFNSSQAYNLSSVPSVHYATENDFLAHLDAEKINTASLAAVRDWLEMPELSQFLSYRDIPLHLVIEPPLARAVTTLVKLYEILKHILDELRPSEIIYFQAAENQKSHDLRIDSHDRLIPGLVNALLSQSPASSTPTLHKITVPIKNPNPCVKPRTTPAAIFAPFFIQIRRLMNQIARKSQNKKSILVVGAPRFMDVILQVLNRQGAYQSSYFQEKTAPRRTMRFDRFSHAYLTLEDYRPTQQREYDPASSLAKWNALLTQTNVFQIHSLNLNPFLAPKFEYLFFTLLPQIWNYVDQIHALFNAHPQQLLIVDEDMSYLSRTLLLTAKSRGIPSAEYQHGVIGSYFLQRPISTAKFVWGNYFKKAAMEQGRLPHDQLQITGALHLENIYAALKPNETRLRARLCRQLKIPQAAKVILYTPHSFRKGSRGGLLGGHHTRQEAETMFQAVLDSLSPLRQPYHLIIKLHHGDHQPDFYRDFISKNAPNTPYTILKNTSIYDLILASDLIITPISTAILEGILFDRPIILMDFEEQRKIFPYSDWLAVETASKPEALPPLAAEILANPQPHFERTKPGRLRIRNEFVNGFTGQAKDHFLREAERLIHAHT